MKYNHILMAGLALTTTATMTSCLFEDDDKFSESAALRIEHYTEEVQTLLCSAENGWVMQYFPNSASKGYNMLCRFSEDGLVTFASDHEYLRNGQSGKYTEATSLYELLKEDGPVLSFNTWNDVLTVFVDPVDPSTGEKDGYGLEGDHNFVVLSSSEDEIVLRGERQSGEIHMLRATKDWQQYLTDASQSKSDFFNSSITGFTLSTATDTLYATGMSTGILTVGERLVNPLVAYTVPFIVTDEGVHFQFAYDLNGVSAQDFVINADSSALVSPDGKMSFAPIWQDFAASHTTLWKLDPASFTAEMQTVYDDLAAAITKGNSAWTLKYIAVGREAGGNAVDYGMYIGVETNKTTQAVRNGGMLLSCERTGETSVRYTANPERVDNNMSTFAKRNDDIKTLAAQFAALIEGEYNIVPNNYFLPSGGTFTSTDGSKTLIFK